MTISNELYKALKLAGLREKDLDIPAYERIIGYPASYIQHIKVDTFKSKYSAFNIIAVQTYFYEHDGQADSSYCEAKYTLLPEQYINNIQLTEAVIKETINHSGKSGQGKDWYYDTISNSTEWEIKELWKGN